MGKKLASPPKPVTRVTGAGSPSANVQQYRKRVDDLYKTVESWTKSWSPQASLKRIPTEITEEAPGTYPAEILEINLPGKRPVRLRPAGCYFIGAEGRVDIESNLGRETLMYLSEGGPAMTIQIRDETGRLLEKPSTTKLRKETAEGWVWVQNRLMRLYPTLNDDLMHRMVEVLG